jgi:hypothetical protein
MHVSLAITRVKYALALTEHGMNFVAQIPYDGIPTLAIARDGIVPDFPDKN